MIFVVIGITLPLCSGLMEGDVAVPRSLTGGKVRDSFLLDASQLWSNGIVPFRFETLALEDGGVEDIFSDDHKQLIREAISHISTHVPCLVFRFSIIFHIVLIQKINW